MLRCTLGRIGIHISQPLLFCFSFLSSLFSISILLFLHKLITIYFLPLPCPLTFISFFLLAYAFSSFGTEGIHLWKSLLSYVSFLSSHPTVLVFLIKFSPFLYPLSYSYPFILSTYSKEEKNILTVFSTTQVRCYLILCWEKNFMLLAVVSLICLSHLSLATLFDCEGYIWGSNCVLFPNVCNRGWSQSLQLSACNGCFSKFYASHFYIFFIISNVF